ncbi:head-tail connector protein [Pseudomonas syringae]|uniref:head-tail connector protein n=1 Tax=Pseudomonas syringae TaxID=317 RepID=UPI0010119560|nr:head-tail connector protein [Pseudomonas syringae]MBI6558125.1 phage gp6-like head-tail connector protein [Pseudomonas syringae]MBI6569166.1 phage gp6-like head-tail connector protein [Pseudomonas syringae]MBI6585167.1 phage gp6-like head-tail connector protein [Pseudomonas syringae]MBI6595723.1 phage gp6-like head-tail connector protein [Pseudomonas syringae]MDC6494323.1 head-tail connector protein [Pseudomonas syringae]
MTVAAADLLPIELIRKQLRVDYEDEDDLIALYAESALAWALWFCDNPKLTDVSDFPASFKAALLLLIGHSFANREAVVIGTITAELPMAVENLLWSCRNWSGTPDPVVLS